jgi:predicted N-acetyltransferase YhbS
MSLLLRPGRADDADACGRICYDAFTTIAAEHNFPADWPSVDFARSVIRLLLSRSDTYSVVAEEDGTIVGSNFMADMRPVAGIGPITVDPHAQNHAIGRAMMEHMLQVAAEHQFASVRLVQAAYHSRSMSLYAKLGFDVREPLVAIRGEPPRVPIAGTAVRAATSADVGACADLCRRVHGLARSAELAEAIGRGSATVVCRGDAITGYATLIGFWGHAVGRSTDDVKALIAGAPEIIGAGVLVPTRNGELFRWCLAHGLRVTQPLTLMSRGLYNEPAGAFLPSILF